MGAESDHLIYDYLSRVGDLAQTVLPVDRRVQLVTELQSDIKRQCGGNDSPAAVRRVLRRMGSPDEVVGAAAGERREQGEQWWRLKETQEPQVPQVPQQSQEPQAPQVPQVQMRPMRPGDELAGLPGMTGGVFMPLTPEEKAEAEAEAEAGEPQEPEAPEGGRSFWRRRRGQGGGEGKDEGKDEVRRMRVPWVETFAALLLVAGAVLGSWLALGLGWLVAYYSPRLTRAQAKFAALTLPGLVAGGALVWLWGRLDHRWGEPIAKGHLDSAIGGAFPVVVRVAAVASAVFLVWKGRRA